METEKLLRDFGLTENEIKVYLKLLETGETTASRLSKVAGIDRHNAYDVIEKLAERGLVCLVKKDGTRYYKPLPAVRFIDILNEREEQLSAMKKKFSEIVPFLSRPSSQKPAEPYDINILVGTDGLKTLFNDQIREGKAVFVINTQPQLFENRMKFFIAADSRERKKKKVRLNVLTANGVKFYDKLPLTVVRYLPDEYASSVNFSVYGDNLALTLLSEPVVLLIRNKELASTFLNYYKLLWSWGSAKKKK
jgi:sugar-specific transcriptional regulator TrmB